MTTTKQIYQLNANPTPALTDESAIDNAANSTYKTSELQRLQLFNLTYAGDPNGNLAGTQLQLCLDTSNSLVYICTTTGDAASAVWTLINTSVFLALAGGTMAGIINMNSHKITNLTDPTNPQDAASKNYVDTTALNGTSVYAASAATLGTVTQSGAGVGATLTNAGAQATFALDGVNPPVGSNVLIKNTATGMTAANEGIYTVTNAGSGSTNWVLTRATSYDTATEINNTGLIVIDNGSTLSGQGWYNSATIVTVDTTSFSYSRFGTTGTVTSVASGTGLTGGPITSTGTLSLAAIAANSLWANVTSGLAVPTVVGTNTFLQQVKSQTFAAGTSTYTPSTGMVYCMVEICGGGGSGGGVAGSTSQSAAASGGGGGGYCRKVYTAANIGADATVVVGAGGTGATAGNNNGNAGSDSTFTPAGTGVTLTAGGGGAGQTGASSASASGAGPASGGSATNGDLNIVGGKSDYSWWLAFANTASFSGNGGNSFFGFGGPGSILAGTGTSAGIAGTGYGSGSGGANAYNSSSNVASAAGQDGACIITEFIAI